MTFDELLYRIRPSVPGAADPMIRQQLVLGARQFCRESHYWVEQVAAVYPYEGQRYYQLQLPEDAEVLALASATQKDEPVRATVNFLGALELDYLPKEDDGQIEIRLVLQPVKSADSLPDRIGQDYGQALVSYALSQLLIQPKKEYTDRELAGFHRAEFNTTVDEARYRRQIGNSEQPRRVAPVRFV